MFGVRARRRTWVAAVVCAFALAGASGAQAYVYWTVYGVGVATDGTTLGRASLNGTGINHSFVSGATAPSTIAVDAQHLYWGNSPTHSIGRANLDGTGANPSFIANATTSGGSLAGIAIDATHIYWTDEHRYVGRANLDGSSPQPHFLDVGAGSTPYGIAVSAGTLYLASNGFNEILRAPASGTSAPTSLVNLPANTLPTGLAVAGGYVYWAALNIGDPYPGGTIGRAVLANGGNLDNSFIPGLGQPLGVATDGNNIFWADHGGSFESIGHALLGSTGAASIQTGYIPEPGGPIGIASDANLDPTSTAVSCSPVSIAVQSPTSCTATVTDNASASRPTGTVIFGSNNTTFFSGSSSSCTLAPGTGPFSACTLAAVPLNTGDMPINVSYAGDAAHYGGTATINVCVGKAGPCTPPPPPPPKKTCRVPKLKGKTTGQARKLLSTAHCALGKVTKPHARRGHKLPPLVIAAQSPTAGKTRALGAKVAVRLGPAPKRHR